MKHLVNLGRFKVLVDTFNTGLELEVLEELFCSSETEDENIFEVLVDDFLSRLTKFDISKLSKIEKIILVWKIRELTLGDDINIVYKCPSCGCPCQQTISVEDLCCTGEEVDRNTFYKKLISKEELERLSENDFSDIDIEDLDFDLYSELISDPKKFFIVYNNKVVLNCSKCKTKSFDNLLTFKGCLKFISEDKFDKLVEWINVLVYYGNFTRQDILNMSPIQRMLEINLFKKIKAKEQDSNGF